MRGKKRMFASIAMGMTILLSLPSLTARTGCVYFPTLGNSSLPNQGAGSNQRMINLFFPPD